MLCQFLVDAVASRVGILVLRSPTTVSQQVACTDAHSNA